MATTNTPHDAAKLIDAQKQAIRNSNSWAMQVAFDDPAQYREAGEFYAREVLGYDNEGVANFMGGFDRSAPDAGGLRIRRDAILDNVRWAANSGDADLADRAARGAGLDSSRAASSPSSPGTGNS